MATRGQVTIVLDNSTESGHFQHRRKFSWTALHTTVLSFQLKSPNPESNTSMFNPKLSNFISSHSPRSALCLIQTGHIHSFPLSFVCSCNAIRMPSCSRCTVIARVRRQHGCSTILPPNTNLGVAVKVFGRCGQCPQPADCK